ncbi:DHS-like NAD/FAD-binding domain-containing protein [Boletus coccyginus]|nr:DHS-like NAD/FAD-binding domain-containing protein [Boletus coccyginus]
MSGPEPHKPPSQNGDTTLSPLHALQLRAFLGAAEDVEVDPDTIEDLLEGLSDDICSEMTELDSDGETSDTEDLSLLVQEQCTPPAVAGTADLEDGDTESLEIRALEEEAIQAWTRDEIRKMMHHLKERGMSSFIREYVFAQNIPIVKLLFAFGISLCPELRNKRPKTLLYFLRVAISRELHLREKLPQYNTIADAVALIRNSKRIMVLTGAGISVSCGIPDFRSRNGLYATLKETGQYDLDDPQQMFDIHYFKENPKVFYSFARYNLRQCQKIPNLDNYCPSKIYPSNFIPSPCHGFIKLLENKNKLLRNYTQNIDTLESIAGVTRVLQCHGSFKTATCLQCRIKVPGAEIEREILDQRVPYCKACLEAHKTAEAQKSKSTKKKRKKRNEWEDESDENDDLLVGVMKVVSRSLSVEVQSDVCLLPLQPDITFFGEKLTDDFDQALLDDRDKVDLLLVIGTSLKVSPVSEILCAFDFVGSFRSTYLP